jgi:hypothetical protein
MLLMIRTTSPMERFGGNDTRNMDMLNADLHLYELKIIFLAYFADQLLRAFLDLVVIKDFFSIFRTPNQVVAGIINRMTRSLDCHAGFIS